METAKHSAIVIKAIVMRFMMLLLQYGEHDRPPWVASKKRAHCAPANEVLQLLNYLARRRHDGCR
jgi:hypothetical protein